MTSLVYDWTAVEVYINPVAIRLCGNFYDREKGLYRQGDLVYIEDQTAPMIDKCIHKTREITSESSS